MNAALSNLGWVLAGLFWMYLRGLVRHQRLLQFTSDHVDCQAREERLLAALNREVAKVHRLHLFAHELAASGGPALVAEVEQHLADQDGSP